MNCSKRTLWVALPVNPMVIPGDWEQDTVDPYAFGPRVPAQRLRVARRRAMSAMSLEASLTGDWLVI